MKKIKVFLAICLLIAVLCGCGDPNSVLLRGEDDFTYGLDLYEQEHDGEVPKSVLDTLDFMLENFTDGVAKPDLGTTPPPTIPDDQVKKIIDGQTSVATSIDEMEAIVAQAMSETLPEVSVRFDKSLLGGMGITDLLMEVVYYRVGGKYIVESLGGVNSFAYAYAEVPGTNEIVATVYFSYFEGYGFSLETVKQMKRDMQAKAEQIVRDLNLKNISEYEAVLAVNRYLSDTCVYTAGNSPYPYMSHTPYGALMYGDCVCEGYAKAAQLLFTLCGVESYYVTGETPGGGHGWNLVKVDGQWYQLDITWNDVDGARDQYLLVTDAYMKLSRTWDYPKFPASAKTPYQP